MKSIFRPLAMTILPFAAAVAFSAATSACGGDVSGTGGGTGSSTATGSTSTATGGSDACKLDPPGKAFTFHVHNGGQKPLRLTWGCGATLPIDLDTASGKQSIGPGAVNNCEVTCDALYSGKASYPCSDCGPGYGADLGPGATVDIKWDRRVYTAHTPEAQCTPIAGAVCALGQPVAADAAQKGVLTVCSDAGMQPDGYCSTAGSLPVSFTADTTKDEATIEVM